MEMAPLCRDVWAFITYLFLKKNLKVPEFVKKVVDTFSKTKIRTACPSLRLRTRPREVVGAVRGRPPPRPRPHPAPQGGGPAPPHPPRLPPPPPPPPEPAPGSGNYHPAYEK